jgi:hypothetical protein
VNPYNLLAEKHDVALFLPRPFEPFFGSSLAAAE